MSLYIVSRKQLHVPAKMARCHAREQEFFRSLLGRTSNRLERESQGSGNAARGLNAHSAPTTTAQTPQLQLLVESENRNIASVAEGQSDGPIDQRQNTIINLRIEAELPRSILAAFAL